MSDTATTETIVVRESEELVNPGRNGVPAYKTFLASSQADLERAIGHYPEEARQDAIWLQCYTRDNCKCNIELLRSTAEKLGYNRSSSYWNNCLRGYYFRKKRGNKIDGDPDAFREIVAALRKHDEQSTLAGKFGFIETPTYKCVCDYINERRALAAACKVGGITGPTGSQKTACLKYHRMMHNHGRTFYFEAPARKTVCGFTRKLGSLFNAKISNKANIREEEIRRNITEEKTIIVDNAQRLYMPEKGNQQPIFDYILELQEDTNSTWILSFTEDFAHGDLVAGRAKNYFEQFIGRMGGGTEILALPPHTPASDLRTIARFYGLNPKSETVMKYLTAWSRLPGRIRILFQRLQRAKQFAQLDGKKHITLEVLAEVDSYIPPSIGEDEVPEDES